MPDSGEVYDELPSVPALASSTLESQMLDLLIDAGPDGLLASVGRVCTNAFNVDDLRWFFLYGF